MSWQASWLNAKREGVGSQAGAGVEVRIFFKIVLL